MKKATNIVFMGMGRAHPEFNKCSSHRRITLRYAGMIPRMITVSIAGVAKMIQSWATMK